MTEKVTIGDAELWHGDCLEILPTLPKVDAVVADPPYGIEFAHSGGDVRGIGAGKYKTRFAKEFIANDDKPFDPGPFLSVAPEVLLWGADHYANRLPDGGRWLIWDKREAPSSLSFADGEVAWINKPGVLRIFRHYWNGMLKASERGIARVHPMQKPVAALEWCLGFIDGQTILDPFMGSGTTLVACAKLGRKSIGIEIDQRYFDIACQRVEDAYRQRRLFA